MTKPAQSEISELKRGAELEVVFRTSQPGQEPQYKTKRARFLSNANKAAHVIVDGELGARKIPWNDIRIIPLDESRAKLSEAPPPKPAPPPPPAPVEHLSLVKPAAEPEAEPEPEAAEPQKPAPAVVPGNPNAAYRVAPREGIDGTHYLDFYGDEMCVLQFGQDVWVAYNPIVGAMGIALIERTHLPKYGAVKLTARFKGDGGERRAVPALSVHLSVLQEWLDDLPRKRMNPTEEQRRTIGVYQRELVKFIEKELGVDSTRPPSRPLNRVQGPARHHTMGKFPALRDPGDEWLTATRKVPPPRSLRDHVEEPPGLPPLKGTKPPAALPPPVAAAEPPKPVVAAEPPKPEPVVAAPEPPPPPPPPPAPEPTGREAALKWGLVALPSPPARDDKPKTKVRLMIERMRLQLVLAEQAEESGHEDLAEQILQLARNA